MRVVIIDPLLLYVRGGAETNDLNLGSSLENNGHIVNYIVGEKVDSACFPISKRDKDVLIPTYFPKDDLLNAHNLLGKFLRFIFYLDFSRRIIFKKPVSLKNADLVLITGRPIVSLSKFVTRSPVVYSIRGNIGYINRWFCRLSDGLIFWGGCEADNPDSFARNIASIKLDPCVDDKFFYKAPSDIALRSKLQMGDPNSHVILYAGRIEPIKQLPHMVSAIRIAVGKGYNIKVVFIGDGSMKRELVVLTDELLPGRVLFAGSQPPKVVGEMMRASDVFMLTSRTENHPIAAKEAISCGLNVIAYDVGRIRKIIDHWDAGSVVEADDIEGLACELCKCLEANQNNNRTESNNRSMLAMETWHEVATRLADWVENEFYQKRKPHSS